MRRTSAASSGLLHPADLERLSGQLSLGLGNVSGVAYGVGYNNLSQFSREFTRAFGANPNTYLPR